MSGVKLRLFAGPSLSVLVCAGAWAEPQAKNDAPKENAGVAAYIGSDAIAIQDLDAKVLKTNMKLAQSLYDARRAVLNDLIMERVLAPEAAKKGVSVELFLRERIAEKAKPVTDADVQAFYDANSARMGKKPFEQMSGQIRTYLVSQGESAARESLLTELKEKAGVKIVLGPPRVDVVLAANDPTKGPANAKVTIVEFSDFQ